MQRQVNGGVESKSRLVGPTTADRGFNQVIGRLSVFSVFSVFSFVSVEREQRGQHRQRGQLGQRGQLV